MVTVWLIGIIFIGLDLFILYNLRDYGDKILKVWMVVLGIILAIIPFAGMVCGITGFLAIFALKSIEGLEFNKDFKLVRWLNKTI